MRALFTACSILVLVALGCGDDSGMPTGGAGGLTPIGGAAAITGGMTAGIAGTGAVTGGMGGMGGGITPDCATFEAMAPGTARGTHDIVGAILRGDGTPTNMMGSCAFSSCHTTGVMKATLDLTAMPDITTVLVNVPSCQAEGIDRVEPGNPLMSWLWIKLTGPFDESTGKVTFAATPKTCNSTAADAPLGLAMPFTGGPSVPLQPAQLFQICSWIEDGAAGPM